MWSLILAGALGAAPPDPLPVDDHLAAIKADNLALQRHGMGVLAGWGGANLLAGGIGWAATEPGRSRAFWQGNAAWNVVNLGIAGLGLAAVPRRRAEPLTEAAVRRQVRGLETALAVNGGLDVGYVATGFLLRHIGARQGDERMRGFGDALLVQGGFLLLFDATMLAISRRRSRILRRGP